MEAKATCEPLSKPAPFSADTHNKCEIAQQHSGSQGSGQTKKLMLGCPTFGRNRMSEVAQSPQVTLWKEHSSTPVDKDSVRLVGPIAQSTNRGMCGSESQPCPPSNPPRSPPIAPSLVQARVVIARAPMRTPQGGGHEASPSTLLQFNEVDATSKAPSRPLDSRWSRRPLGNVQLGPQCKGEEPCQGMRADQQELSSLAHSAPRTTLWGTCREEPSEERTHPRKPRFENSTDYSTSTFCAKVSLRDTRDGLRHVLSFAGSTASTSLGCAPHRTPRNCCAPPRFQAKVMLILSIERLVCG